MSELSSDVCLTQKNQHLHCPDLKKKSYFVCVLSQYEYLKGQLGCNKQINTVYFK